MSTAASPWVYCFVFLWVVIDAFFPPAPSDVLVIALSALSVSAGTPNPWILALVAALSAVVGDNISYWIGRSIGVERWRWMRGRRAQAAIVAARDGLSRRAVVLMLTWRYIPIGRVAVTMTAGATAFPRRRFVPLSILAGLSWSTYMVVVGATAGTWANENPIMSIGFAIVTAIVLGTAIERILGLVDARREATRHAAPLP